MSNELLHALSIQSIVIGVVILLLCLLRMPLRRAFGARLAYLLWAAIPVASIAATLPAARMPAAVQQVVAPLRQLTATAAPAAVPVATQWPQWLASIWLALCLAMLLSLWRAHRRYHRSIGPLRRQDGVYYSATQGPAVVGWLRPVIILPADFSTRYTACEQQLILAHEAVHVSRYDPLANSLCALLQCLLWFHPLVHLAARRFRLDQELACDAAVMHAHPGQRRSYAEAMLKTQISAQAALIHCHWQSTHPLKERIMQLQQTPPTTIRRMLGRAAAAAIIAACGYGAAAANTGATHPDRYMVQMKLTAGGASSAPAILVEEGAQAAVASGAWRTEFTLNKSGDRNVFMKAVVKQDGRVVGTPGLLVQVGEAAAVAIGDDYKLQLTINKQRD